MASLVSLKESTIKYIRRAKVLLSPCQEMMPQFQWADERLDLAIIAIKKIDVKSYKKLKRLGGDTNVAFDKPIKDTKEALYTGNISVSYAVKEIIRLQSENPNHDVLEAAGNVRDYLKKISQKIRQIESPLWRALLSGWPPAILIIVAIVYAASYFIFRNAVILHPGTVTSISEIVQSAKAQFGSVANNASHGAGSPIETMGKVVKGLTKLISAIPPLLASIAALYVAIQKMILR